MKALLLVVLLLASAPQLPEPPVPVLPAGATSKLVQSLEQSQAHARHIWRDTAALNADGTVNGYIEIPRHDRRKWEFDIARNARAIDRVIPRDIGGYPVNYGFVPQTVSYDGDPFDVLVIGPPISGGRVARGVIVGLMHMRDGGIVDSKVVLSTVGRDGRPTHMLGAEDKREMAEYFSRYKRDEPGARTEVPGWGSAAEGLAFVRMTHAFFQRCRNRAGLECSLSDATAR